MKRVLTIGEPLVVFKANDKDRKLVDSINYTRYVAGAELNVCVGLKRLGLEPMYITRVGDDLFGDAVYEHINKLGIDTSYIKKISGYKTGFYLKSHVTNADPDVYYYRKDTAINHIREKEISDIDLDGVCCGHFTGIMAALSQNTYEITKSLMQRLNEKNILVVFDPNIRKNLWESEERLVKSTNELVKYANIFMPGISEAKLLTGLNDIEDIKNWYFNKYSNLDILVIKLGTKGAYVAKKGEDGFVVDAYKVDNVVDTVGAGDGFATGLISGIVKGMNLHDSVKRACAIGALAVTSEGDNDGYPTEKELNDFMKG